MTELYFEGFLVGIIVHYLCNRLWLPCLCTDIILVQFCFILSKIHDYQEFRMSCFMKYIMLFYIVLFSLAIILCTFARRSYDLDSYVHELDIGLVNLFKLAGVCQMIFV